MPSVIPVTLPAEAELVLRGQVTLTGTDGTTHSFGEGSSFTVPAG